MSPSTQRRIVRASLAAVTTLTLLTASTALVVGCRLQTRTPQPAVFEEAPDFTLPDYEGQDVSLGSLLEGGPAVLVFYRGYW